MAAEYDEILARLLPHLQRFAEPEVKLNEDVSLIEGLGLDSNKVLDLILEVEDEFDISMPMNLLADVHTVRDLAQIIEQRQPMQE